MLRLWFATAPTPEGPETVRTRTLRNMTFSPSEHDGAIRMHALNRLDRLGHGCCFHNFRSPQSRGGGVGSSL